jgi:2-(1,2-epoxy-1,2-dihydrophenyl)acetyl-CoA isomerase
LDVELIETRDGRVALLTLNRPDSLNALNPSLMRTLTETLQSIAEDESVGCVVLTGAGRGFCSGGDTRAIAKATNERAEGVEAKPRTTEERAQWLRRCAEASRLLHDMPKPTIAMINGPCAGAGLSMAGACDFRFAGASATFFGAFTSNGMPGDYGSSWVWTQVLGAAKARQLILLDEKRDAAAAHAFGIVDRLYANEALREETMKVAHVLASRPPSGLALAKANLNAAHTLAFDAYLDLESLNMMRGREALIAARKAATPES